MKVLIEILQDTSRGQGRCTCRLAVVVVVVLFVIREYSTLLVQEYGSILLAEI
jgi:hypothetical protein